MNILIVDDHFLVIDGLKTLLSTFDFVFKTSTAMTFEDIRSIIKKEEIHFVLLDISLGKDDGRDVLFYLKENLKDIKVIALTSHDDASTIKSCFKAGFDGYILKNDDRSTIAAALLSVQAGERFFSPQTDFAFQKDLKDLDDMNLSLREMEVLELIGAGHTTKEIADRLFISQKTVETHRSKIMSKLRVRNVAELIRKALRLKLISLY